MAKIDATLIGGGDTLEFENGFITSSCYRKGSVVGKVSHSLFTPIVYGLLVVANEDHNKEIESPVNTMEIVEIINKFITWI